ncbi:MAG TPA: hypothetical protein VFK57_17225 [Vicinamibacterales bacterium]|nr:hypothetical protein [Vicinamibacterales bacterium]
MRTTYRDRQAARLENGALRVTVLQEGGHIAEIADKATGINPLWTPAWPSIEPSQYDPARHPEYGGGADAALLAGIMGHNLCLDMFGGPSAEEAAAGLPVHGEVSTARFAIEPESAGALSMRARLPEAQLEFERRLALADRTLRVRERVTNRSATDRAIGWTQHVTLGPPFVEHGRTALRASARRGRVFEGPFGPADYLTAAADFEWPHAPRVGGGTADLRTYSSAPASSAYTVQQMDPSREDAFVAAHSPSAGLTFGCVWRRADFPWLGLWEENRARPSAPWNGRAVTWGLEFGVSPFPETRRQMIERGPLFGTPTLRWIPARQTVEVEYWMLLVPAAAPPDELTRPTW